MKKQILNTMLVVCFLLFVTACSQYTPKTIFVKTAASGTADGLSWSNALGDIQSAIDMANEGDSIWIAAGKYIPKSDTGYIVTKGISILGGFKGDEKFAKDRQLKDTIEGKKMFVYETIICGDRNNDDDISKWNMEYMEDANSRSFCWTNCNMKDNCMHLFFAPRPFKSLVLFDGLKLMSAVADGRGIHGYGGAISVKTNLTVKNCDIKSCYAVKDGGGIFSVSESLNITNCLIHECWANNGGGIASRQKNGKSIIIENNLIWSCYAATHGGGIMQLSKFKNSEVDSKISNNILHKCSVYCNATESFGGGIYQKVEGEYDKGVLKVSKFHVDSNRFFQCTAILNIKKNSMNKAQGGGLFFHRSIASQKVNCLIRKNDFYNCHIDAFEGYGAGASVLGGVTFDNNIVRYCYLNCTGKQQRRYSILSRYNNKLSGAGVYCSGGIVTNSLIYNCASYKGSAGGVCCDSYGKVKNSKIINCYAANSGGCVYVTGDADVNNCLIANGYAGVGGGAVNAGTSSDAPGHNPFITHSTIVNSFAELWTGGVNLSGSSHMHDCIVFNNNLAKGSFSSLENKQFYSSSSYLSGSAYITGCAISGYRSGGRNNHALGLKNKPGKYKKRGIIYPHFKKPTKIRSYIDPWELKTSKQKKAYNEVMGADWGLEETSPCADLGCTNKVASLNPEMWLKK